MGKKLTEVIEPEVKEELKQISEETVSDKKETVFIYVGPANNYLSRFSIYRNGLPVHMEEHFEAFPILKSLFVAPEKLSDFVQKVSQEGTIESIWYGEAKKYFEGKVK